MAFSLDRKDLLIICNGQRLRLKGMVDSYQNPAAHPDPEMRVKLLATYTAQLETVEALKRALLAGRTIELTGSVTGRAA